MAPARVTFARIAKEANADRKLLGYYFGNRAGLLVAVIDRVTAHAALGDTFRDAPTAALAEHIGQTVRFLRSAPFMHRLILDELAQNGTEESKNRIRDMNLDLIQYYRELLATDNEMELVPADPFFLHLAISPLFSRSWSGSSWLTKRCRTGRKTCWLV